MIGSIIYILPVSGYSGGANSVVQEVSGLQRMGLRASIAVDERNYANLTSAYADIPSITSTTRSYSSKRELAALLSASDVAVATVATSVSSLVETWDTLSTKQRPRLFYYTQDYEPFFFEPHTEQWALARKSYEYGSVLRGFAKTDWICNTITSRHNMAVSRVTASIDHSVFFPILNRPRTTISIAAMIRPSTPRRAPRRTCRIISKLSEEIGSSAVIHTFGCSTDELREHGLALPASVTHHGRLTREQVAHLLRQTDLFLDLSDYQAFGRTGLEAMACGAAPIVTVFGGVDEYLVHRTNGYAVDVRYDESIMNEILHFISLPTTSRESIRLSGIQTAARYTIQGACSSILSILFAD